MVTALNPDLGYELCSELANTAVAENKGIYQLVKERGLLPEHRLEELLSPEKMVGLTKG